MYFPLKKKFLICLVIFSHPSLIYKAFFVSKHFILLILLVIHNYIKWKNMRWKREKQKIFLSLLSIHHI